MNRFRLGLGIFLVLLGLAATIVLGITKPESYTIVGSIINIMIGSFIIAFAFPKAT